MTIQFGYVKAKVIQALRYHFISRREILIMIILVNVFALASVVLYFLHKATPVAFLMGTFLWLALMASFWFILPLIVYRKAVTFRHEFEMDFDEEGFTLRHERGSKRWAWKALDHYKESPHFFHFYFDNRSFILVPKEGCKNTDEVFELRKLIKDHVRKG
jgi:hypothetical protein